MKKIFTRPKSHLEPYTNSIAKVKGKIWRAATFFLAILLYCYIAILLPAPAFAQDPLDSRPMGAGDMSLETFVPISVTEVASGLNCQITGYNPSQKEGKGCVFRDQEGKLRIAQKPGGGAVAFTGNLIAAMYANPPASGIQYLADLGKNLGVVSPAYAAVGTGFSGLSPILPIWKAFRNIAYLFFTIIFIVVGFAIMFRVKISPQAVVTIQSALPRIIMTLILVTFSYAIAGFLIDLMYILMVLLATIFKSIPGFPEFAKLNIDEKLAGNIIRVFWELPGLGGAAIMTPAGVVKDTIAAITGGIPGFSGLLGVVGGALAMLIIAIAIIVSLFRLFFSLLMAYISIIIAVIFAPFQIMLDTIPGQSGFGSWFRNLIANLAVFPATLVMFLIAGLLIESIAQGANTQEGWVAPFLGGGWGGGLAGLIGLGIILMTPKVVDMVKEALKVPPFRYGAAIGEAIQPGSMATRGVAIPWAAQHGLAPAGTLRGSIYEFGKGQKWWG